MQVSRAAVAAFLLVWSTSSAIGQETAPASPDAAQAILERAIRATGGGNRLTRQRAATWKARGRIYGLKEPILFTGDWAVQWPDRMRVTLETQLDGRPFKVASAFSDGRGWIYADGKIHDMTTAETADAKEELYLGELGRLLILTGKSVTLSTVKETQINGRTAVGLRVVSKGRRDATLYFDRDSGLLAKIETTSKDTPQGRETARETVFSDFRSVAGLKVPFKMVERRAAKLYLESEITEYKAAENLDASLFERP
jgi:hypothetical protein